MSPRSNKKKNQKNRGRKKQQQQQQTNNELAVDARDNTTYDDADGWMEISLLHGRACLHRRDPAPWRNDSICKASLSFINAHFNRLNGPDNIEKLMKEIPGSVSHCENTIQVLQSMGTDRLLEAGTDLATAKHVAKCFADLINSLEINRAADDAAAAASSVFTHETAAYLHQCMANLSELDSYRKCVSFFRKRIPCTCLDQAYQEARQRVQEGECQVCNKVKDDKLMFSCGKCNLRKYCSKECQVKHWPEHKEECKEFAKSQF